MKNVGTVIQLIVLLFADFLVFSKKQYVSDCYQTGSVDDKFAVTFFCSDQYHVISYFEFDFIKYCRNSSHPYLMESRTEKIRFDDCQMSQISLKIFATFKNLRILDISSMELELLTLEVFMGADALEELNVSQNQLSVIRLNQFLLAESLKSVNLSYNNIRTIEKGAFNYRVNQLTLINLSHNQIRQIPSQTFHKLPHLLQLNLSHNQLKSIEMGTFAKQINLNTLDLSFNMIKAIDLEKVLPHKSWIHRFFIESNSLHRVSGYNQHLFPHSIWSKSFVLSRPPPNDHVIEKLSDIASNIRKSNDGVYTVQSTNSGVVWTLTLATSVSMLVVFVKQTRQLQSFQIQLNSMKRGFCEAEGAKMCSAASESLYDTIGF